MSDNKFQAWLKTLPCWQQLAVFSAIIMPLIIGADFIKAKLTEKIDSPNACLSHIQGVWTFTQPLAGAYAKQPFWERYDFTKNGVQVQNAYPTETEWGTPTSYGYSIEMKKTADTGEWHCRVRLDGTAINLAVFSNGDVNVFRPLSPDLPYLVLTKRDKQLNR